MNESEYKVGCIVEILLFDKAEHIMLCTNPFNNKLAGVNLHDGKIGIGEFNNIYEFEETMQQFTIMCIYDNLTDMVSTTILNMMEDGEHDE